MVGSAAMERELRGAMPMARGEQESLQELSEVQTLARNLASEYIYIYMYI